MNVPRLTYALDLMQFVQMSVAAIAVPIKTAHRITWMIHHIKSKLQFIEKKTKNWKKQFAFQSLQAYIIDMWSRWYGMLSSARFNHVPFHNPGIEYDFTADRASSIHIQRTELVWKYRFRYENRPCSSWRSYSTGEWKILQVWISISWTLFISLIESRLNKNWKRFISAWTNTKTKRV